LLVVDLDVAVWLLCGCLLQLHTYSEPLHQLQAITEANLKFDLLDCMQMT
jgi:hypothetical protein